MDVRGDERPTTAWSSDRHRGPQATRRRSARSSDRRLLPRANTRALRLDSPNGRRPGQSGRCPRRSQPGHARSSACPQRLLGASEFSMRRGPRRGGADPHHTLRCGLPNHAQPSDCRPGADAALVGATEVSALGCGRSSLPTRMIQPSVVPLSRTESGEVVPEDPIEHGVGAGRAASQRASAFVGAHPDSCPERGRHYLEHVVHVHG